MLVFAPRIDSFVNKYPWIGTVLVAGAFPFVVELRHMPTKEIQATVYVRGRVE